MYLHTHHTQAKTKQNGQVSMGQIFKHRHTSKLELGI